MTPIPPGYSGSPLAKKLGLKPGTRLLAINPPPEYRDWLGKLPDQATQNKQAGPSIDLAHVFATERRELTRELKRLRKALRPDAATWVSWPKKASKVATDLTEDVVREVALPLGFVDIKVCAVSEIWSGLKLVVRKHLR